jgi:hypothetical protein
MEMSIGSIVTKIDVVLIKLDQMERSRNKKRALMGQMMTTITEDPDSKN